MKEVSLVTCTSETARFTPISTHPHSLPRKDGKTRSWVKMSELVNPIELTGCKSISELTGKINCFAVTRPRMFSEMRRKSFVYF